MHECFYRFHISCVQGPGGNHFAPITLPITDKDVERELLNIACTALLTYSAAIVQSHSNPVRYYQVERFLAKKRIVTLRCCSTQT